MTVAEEILRAENLVADESNEEIPLLAAEVVNYVYHVENEPPKIIRAIILEVKMDGTAVITLDTTHLHHDHHNVKISCEKINGLALTLQSYSSAAVAYAVEVEDKLLLLSLAKDRDVLNIDEIAVCKVAVQLSIGEDANRSIASLLFNPITCKPYLFISPLPTITIAVSSDGQSMHQKLILQVLDFDLLSRNQVTIFQN